MNILKLLKQDDFYGVSEEIEIAKGKNKLPETFKEGFKQLKRQKEWLKRRK